MYLALLDSLMQYYFMKITLHYQRIYLVVISFFIIIACNTKEPNTAMTTSKEYAAAGIKTIENMQTAYKGEKTATAKYEAFSKKAETEGYHLIALLYNAVSAAENIHAMNHKSVIEDAGGIAAVIVPEFKVKSTKENLSEDINGEAYEAKTMYPDFLKTAEIAGNQIALLSLTYAMKTEQKHKVFFEKALGDLNSNTLLSLPPKYQVCPVCGNTYTEAPKHCDFSLTPRESFLIFQ